ncbi:Repressed by EFG1 protein 1 [Neolecta irregularis DAH-3]|uniref:Repressed by EFG1 protein 1 n=1 Tax=Neolecta irregularis (strain DAH-3) TaxID=1198029 RepID=A0A1U7LVU1_NEOID|nr:Repressed by EFG1 protein 1 [Neolecta irregularis DAH-3]|eukprot:OLL26739.1 Repressed by EFG1 protein 1 [Neolecta irregularis DAH-3]
MAREHIIEETQQDTPTTVKPPGNGQGNHNSGSGTGSSPNPSSSDGTPTNPIASLLPVNKPQSSPPAPMSPCSDDAATPTESPNPAGLRVQTPPPLKHNLTYVPQKANISFVKPPAKASGNKTRRDDSSSSTSASSSYALSVLNLHNDMRASHDAVPMTWNENLAVAALRNSQMCKFEHPQGYGSNLAYGISDPLKEIQKWYNEFHDVNFSNIMFTEATGHFTQLVWNSSKELGCATYHCSNRFGPLLTCLYNPPGNVDGLDPITGKTYYSENVSNKL